MSHSAAQVRGLCTDLSNRDALFDTVRVYGNILNSEIYGNWYGHYSFGHLGGVFSNNLMHSECNFHQFINSRNEKNELKQGQKIKFSYGIEKGGNFYVHEGRDGRRGKFEIGNEGCVKECAGIERLVLHRLHDRVPAVRYLFYITIV